MLLAAVIPNLLYSVFCQLVLKFNSSLLFIYHIHIHQQDTPSYTTAHPCCLLALNIHNFHYSYLAYSKYIGLVQFSSSFLSVMWTKLKLVLLLLLSLYAEELQTDILEQG